MWREEPVIGAVFRAPDGHVEQAVGVKVLRVDLGAGYRREDLKLVTRQPAVITIAGQATAYDAAVIDSSNEFLFKGLDQLLRAAHPLDPAVRLDRHLSSCRCLYFFSRKFIRRTGMKSNRRLLCVSARLCVLARYGRFR